jgi:hypothetical protein
VLDKMGRVCIIPCGNKKIWDIKDTNEPHRAKETYVGTFHKLCQAYSKAFFDVWIILSAKHGFLLPDDLVSENYNLSFSMKEKNEKIISIEELKEQILKKNLSEVDVIVVLGGKKFNKIIEGVFPTRDISFPLQKFSGIGYMQQHLKRAIESKQELT